MPSSNHTGVLQKEGCRPTDACRLWRKTEGGRDKDRKRRKPSINRELYEFKPTHTLLSDLCRTIGNTFGCSSPPAPIGGSPSQHWADALWFT